MPRALRYDDKNRANKLCTYSIKALLKRNFTHDLHNPKEQSLEWCAVCVCESFNVFCTHFGFKTTRQKKVKDLESIIVQNRLLLNIELFAIRERMKRSSHTCYIAENGLEAGNIVVL